MLRGSESEPSHYTFSLLILHFNQILIVEVLSNFKEVNHFFIVLSVDFLRSFLYKQSKFKSKIL